MQVYSNARSSSSSNYRIGFLKRYKHNIHKQTISCLHLPLANGEPKPLSCKSALIWGTGAERAFKDREKTLKSCFRMGNTRKGLEHGRKRPIPTEWMTDCISLCDFWPQRTYPLWVSILCIWRCGGGDWVSSEVLCISVPHYATIILGSVSEEGGNELTSATGRAAGWYSFGKKGAVWIKLKMCIPCDPAMSFLGTLLRETFTHVHRDKDKNSHGNVSKWPKWERNIYVYQQKNKERINKIWPLHTKESYTAVKKND